MTFTTNNGIKDMRKWLNDMADMPSERLLDELNAAARAAAGHAEAATHIQTGMLKGSMLHSSGKTEDGNWEAEISWDTDYTKYEFARDGHNPMDTLAIDEENIDRIIQSGP